MVPFWVCERPPDRLSGRPGTGAERTQEVRAYRGDENGTAHDEKHIALPEAEHVVNDHGVRDVRPGKEEPKGGADQQADHTLAPHRATSHASAFVSATAVAKKVIVATTLAGDPRDIPQSPCPDVQPPAMRPPNPMAKPAARSAIG